MGGIEARLQELGVTLPTPPAPVASYVPFVITGKLVHVSGQVSVDASGGIKGKLGDQIEVEEGQAAARLRRWPNSRSWTVRCGMRTGGAGRRLGSTIRRRMWRRLAGGRHGKRSSASTTGRTPRRRSRSSSSRGNCAPSAWPTGTREATPRPFGRGASCPLRVPTR